MSYPHKGGVAVSYDLQHFRKVSEDAPVLASPEGTGCLRYLSVVPAKGQLYYYYEYARADGAHELRLSVVDVTPGVRKP